MKDKQSGKRDNKIQCFLSYNFDDEDYVEKVDHYLSTQSRIITYFWGKKGRGDDYLEQIGMAISKSHAFLLFLSEHLGKTQQIEANKALPGGNEKLGYRIPIKLPNVLDIPTGYSRYPAVTLKEKNDKSALECAKKIVHLLQLDWEHIDRPVIPKRYIFDYEKSIINEYVKGEGKLNKEFVAEGCPREWPTVEKGNRTEPNPIPESEIGLYRDWDRNIEASKESDPQVTSAALSEYISKYHLTFPEAGPRKFLYYPTREDRKLTIGILVSGGIAPGVNSVISGIVERQFLYAGRGNEETLQILGYQNGFSALTQHGVHHYYLLKPKDYSAIEITDDRGATLVTGAANDSGSMIGSSRVEKLAEESTSNKAVEQVVSRLENDGVEILYIIGGHGSMRAAHAIWQKAQDIGSGLSVVAVPKSMDNDILWVWQSFGFMSAVEQAKGLIGHMCTEVKSHPGLCVIQLFGSDSGFVASHAVLASGMCDLCLIPEVPYTIEAISRYITERLKDRQIQPHSIIVMAETAVPQDAKKYFEDQDIALTGEEIEEIEKYLSAGRLPGHTPDPLRRGALKLVSRVLEKKIQQMKGEQWKSFRVITNEPKHQLRAVPPSCSDVIFGRRIGSLAVDCAMAGYTDFMISQWLTEYVMVPLRLVILGRKRIPEQGIFWRSVKTSTGQPDNLDS